MITFVRRADCEWKRTYATFAEAEAAAERTPGKPGETWERSTLYSYRCQQHDGYHVGHGYPPLRVISGRGPRQ